jgi:hypothetical protein
MSKGGSFDLHADMARVEARIGNSMAVVPSILMLVS